LGAEEREILAHGGVQSDISDLSEPENRFDRRWSKLLEVYLPVRASDGTPLLFETYMRYSSVVANGHGLWSGLWPMLLAALLVLEALQLPLVWSLAKRLNVLVREQRTTIDRLRSVDEMKDGILNTVS